MNKKGFTLVEILAVIVILGIVMVVVGTKGFGAFDKTKGNITNLNKETVVKAANMLAIDLDNCDDDLDGDLISNLNVSNCSDLQDKLNSADCVETNIKFLKDNEYVTGNGIKDLNENTKIKLCKEDGVINIYDKDGNLLSKNSIKDAIKNPYTEGTLANKIIVNVANNENGTELKEKPIISVASSSSQYGTGEYKTEIKYSLESDLSAWFLVTGDGFAADNPTSYTEMIGRNVVSESNGYTNPVYVENVVLSDGILEITIKKEKTASEQTLASATDDYGTSYYYRGAVKDNYVNFAGMCWRIVRIQGDGSIKLILQDRDNNCETNNGNWNISTSTAITNFIGTFGVQKEGRKFISNYLNPNLQPNFSLSYVFRNFEGKFTAGEKSKMKSGGWCLGDKGYSRTGEPYNYTYTLLGKDEMKINKLNSNEELYYDSYRRLHDIDGNKEASLKCNGTLMDNWGDNSPMYVGGLTADEAMFAGGAWGIINKNYYLLDGIKKPFFTLSLSTYSDNYDVAIGVDIDGSVDDYVNNSFLKMNIVLSFRPAIVLSNTIQFSEGDGSKSNPYIVD